MNRTSLLKQREIHYAKVLSGNYADATQIASGRQTLNKGQCLVTERKRPPTGNSSGNRFGRQCAHHTPSSHMSPT